MVWPAVSTCELCAASHVAEAARCLAHVAIVAACYLDELIFGLSRRSDGGRGLVSRH